MDTKAKCRHLKKDLYRDFAEGVYLSGALSHPMTPYPPPLTHCIRVYSIPVLIHTGKGERGKNWTIVKVRGATVHKDGSKIPT